MKMDDDLFVDEPLPKAADDELFVDELHPAAQAQKVPEVSALESGIRGAAQSASLGFADELAGLVGGAKALFTPGQSVAEGYRKERDESRALYKAAEEANPKAYLGGELAGGLATAAIPGLGAAKAASLGAKALQAAKIGATLGGVSALGGSEADVTKGQVGQALQETALGAGLGGVVGAAAEPLVGIGKSVVQKVQKWADPIKNVQNALGALPSDLKGIPGDKLRSAIKGLEERGLFSQAEQGLNVNTLNFDKVANKIVPASREDIGNRVSSALESLGKQYQEVAKFADNAIAQDPANIQKLQKVDLGEALNTLKSKYLSSELRPAVETIKDLSQEISQISSAQDYRALMDKITNTMKASVWDVATPGANIKNEALKEVKKAMSRNWADAIDGMYKASPDEIRQALPFDGNYVRKMNQLYGQLSEVDDLLVKTIPKDKTITDQLIGGGVRGALGGSLGYAASGGQGDVATAGALTSAALGTSQGQMALAALKRALPRSVEGAKRFLQKNYQALPMELRTLADKLLPEQSMEASEAIYRAAIPQLKDFLRPSEYESEVNGKISDPKDKARFVQKVKASVTNPIERAKKISAMNQDGTIGESSEERQENQRSLEDLLGE